MTVVKRTFTAGAIALAMGAAVSFNWEGPQYRSAYLDPLQIATICRGITQGVKMGDTATAEECDERELKAIKQAAVIVEVCARVPLADHEWAAWISFTYNVGPGGRGVKDGFCFLKSGARPTLLKKLWALDYTGACNELPKWDNPKWLGGIRKRRLEEQAVCLGDLSSLRHLSLSPLPQQ